MERPDKFTANILTPEKADQLIAHFNAPLHGTYVEIGPALQPYLLRPLGNRAATLAFGGQNARYIGIDGGRSSYESVQGQEIIGWGAVEKTPDGDFIMSNPSARLVETSAGRFYAGVLDDVHARGHTSAAIIVGDAQQTPFATASVQEVYASNVILTPDMAGSSIQRIAEETRRILADDGLFIIAEDALDGSSELIAHLRQAGFAEVYVLRSGYPSEVIEMVRRQFGTAYMQSIIIARGGAVPETTVTDLIEIPQLAQVQQLQARGRSFIRRIT